MLRRLAFLSLVLMFALALLSTGCGPKEEPVITPEPEPVEEPEPVVEEPPAEEVTEPFPSEPVVTEEQPVKPSIAELNERGVLRTVYFAFDSFELDDAARAILQANADWLKDNGPYNILVEGHCDERGTIEYNLALGERRASTVRDYMSSLGIPASSIRIVSYGEERPVNSGHNEAAWNENRRGQFLIES